MVTLRMLPRLCLALMVIASVGCAARRTEIANPIPVGVAEYDAVFDATLDVLRDHRFQIARRDRRYGLITTEPRTAASALEVWHPDRTTPGQVARNSINHQRYRIVARIRPRQDDPAATDDNATSPEDADGPDQAGGGDYELAVEARLARRQLPPRILNTAAVANTRVRRKAGVVRPIFTEAGDIEPHWRPVGRDREYERRLVATILQRATRTEVPPAESGPEPPADDEPGEGPYEPYRPGPSADEPPADAAPDDAPDTDQPPDEDDTPSDDDNPRRYQPYPHETGTDDMRPAPARTG